jgi:hypothetical protein
MHFSSIGSTAPAHLIRAVWQLLLGGVACALLAACNPSLNWREVRAKEGPLLALLPCKAEASSRKVSLGGHEVQMALNSCTAADALFVVGQATVPEASALVALKHWQHAALASISVLPTSQALKASPLQVAGLADTPFLLTTEGHRANGTGVQFSGLWFLRGGQVFHAAIYADRISAEMSEPFFSGLKLQ